MPFSGVSSLVRSARLRHQPSSTTPPNPSSKPLRGALESFTKPIAMSHQIHTYTKLQQQIHDGLLIQHPEWIKSNGECPSCDSYESRLAELLGSLNAKGSNGSVAAIYRTVEQGVAER